MPTDERHAIGSSVYKNSICWFGSSRFVQPESDLMDEGEDSEPPRYLGVQDLIHMFDGRKQARLVVSVAGDAD